MKVKVSETNVPQWNGITVKSQIPEKLKKLEEMAYNIMWSWDSGLIALFNDINPELWKSTGGNPVLMLQSLSYKQLEAITSDVKLMARIDGVYSVFRAYMDEPAKSDVPSIAYFSMEFGLTSVLKIYSGGLGVLAGDYLKETSDYNINMTGVGFLYRYGYFTQSLSMDGQQLANYEAQKFSQLPVEQIKDEDGRPIILEVPYPGRVVYSYIWRVNIGRVPLYLMDTDLPLNSEFDRPITHQLYGGDWEHRMKQEYMLGIGGILMLERLGIKKDIYHCNEGHAALINVQRLVQYVQNEKLSFAEAIEVVRASSLYTVHTPVPAGHDSFDEGLFGKYMYEYPEKLGISFNELMDLGRENPGTDEKFSMSVFACNTCQEVNGVSWLHGKVSQHMFQPIWKGYTADELHVGYVTNGVHLPTWAATEWKEFYAEKLDKNLLQKQEDRAAWAKIQDVPDQEIWDLRLAMKNKLVNFVKAEFRDKWLSNQGDPSRIMSILEKINPNALLIGFARRFATYKRAHLLFTDLDRLSRLVNNPAYPVQFIFSGKAHPADGMGQDLIKRIIEVSRRPEFLGKIIFLENYDMQVAKRLISGVDIWMNTPTRPLEASGTSGEKAQMNGVLNFSVLDGWWYEGYKEGAGWALTDKRTFQNQEYQDQLDAATIYSMFENEIVPLYFAKNSKGYSPEWVQYIKNSMEQISPEFTMNRMLIDYIERFYKKEADRSTRIKAHDYKLAKELAVWKAEVASKWDEIEIVEVKMPEELEDGAVAQIGTVYPIDVVVDRKGLPNTFGVELVVASTDDEGKDKYQTFDIPEVEVCGDITKYHFESKVLSTGAYRFALRLYPKHEELPHRQDFAYVRWFTKTCNR